MVDFKRLNEELDAAGYDLHKVEKSTSEPATGLKLLLQCQSEASVGRAHCGIERRSLSEELA